MTSNFSSTVAGLPRIGAKRELKFALEGYWNGSIEGRELAQTARQLVNTASDSLSGLDSVPFAGRSYYDAMLDTAAILGVLPERFDDIADHENDGLPLWIDRYFGAARGTETLPAQAMTKWFDTNYHYLVPELSADTRFVLDASALIEDLRCQQVRGVNARPVLVGPLTFLSLARTTDGSNPLDHLPALFEVYERLIKSFDTEWVQIDEPALVTDVAPEVLEQVRAGYTTLAKRDGVFVNTYFGSGDQALNTLAGIGLGAIGVDLVTHGVTELAAWKGEELLVAGIVDGRNIWRTDLCAALASLKRLAARGPIAVSTSCSLLHVPYTLEAENIEPEVRDWLAFGSEKITEVKLLADALAGNIDAAAFDAASAAIASRRTSPRTAPITQELPGRSRGSFDTRVTLQEKSLELPALPTTTIGSFPQTPSIRSARARLRKESITLEQYEEAMREEIDLVIAKQEELGLDVLVHGEPERNDMVQYFSELLDGFLSTANGWVQSYGSRCVRPPVLFGNVSRPAPMTVKWFQYAQSLTQKHVKGMLTGPVTILAWSFVRDDQPLATTADQVALALRDEINDLIEAGAKIIQVDEPAIRELLPLRDVDKPAYLQWSVDSFRLATAGAPDDVQIHTHMCYSEFNEVISSVIALDADVTTIEAARSDMQVLAALKSSGFELGVGPGVWDIHSPRVPSAQEVDGLLEAALQSVDPRQLWVNPDCGLKTRGWPEVEASLKVLVESAKQAREKIGATI
ncbi:5-Methyltetrahydropteroyltriglutamate-homocysteine methyltransferase [Corynebacterium glutamicum MB001]|uniref:5-methyltetrahydropteroyltriglutamate--homocysteine methyltransferase n=1 Tax=Corynebacterium glutamicum (strain ATCC 13032 / DSM 20300 / JCM 1318 / BCRC 11384 / CCUG 27702 / LMG 3730 / NBRC 12168 / NCIMB 10025 / NRRL B-2784 / 534) TaxID=196627 RepID=METE_CORGL|nr:5-methyltetrahydropteroyltriglutamate--homocysteine S-methyltransferase [Corynebacterium glutamicum]Q8NRB3.1 RecName: Full=5-methyltetrahydropteroyltriglutamate--homocysteine methyltransferase; AltName: Full=Cobalamin-independent methionine synthase; AltName: Full=Methionine synthase, vitamin-B12 independent isozyme [Corynebacterium glutamicum ATCC 13032]AGT05131.1 5-Methyltetrahydropteroyltriglutamate-homocysteine methyltransferase [Corynebacterium glutamicum MB001]ASW13794.1 5-Methyltetrahy